MRSDDPFEVLQTALRAVTVEPFTDVQVEQVVGRAIESTTTNRSPRPGRRRGFLVIGIIACASIGGGIAAAVLHKERVPRPEGGVACRAEADPLSDAVVIGQLTTDPIGDCAKLWAAGGLPDTRHPENNDGAVPRLIACVSPGGSIDVLPVAENITCESIGLALADIAAGAADPAVELQRRLSDDLPRCSTIDHAEAFVERQLDELELTDWQIVIRPGDLTCALTGIDSELKTVFIVPGSPPNSPPNTEGSP